MNILHLTDLHFSIDDENSRVADKWKEIIALAKNSNILRPVDVIAVTGDITCHGLDIEFEQAQIYLMMLMRALSVKKESVLFCPGNHDADYEEAGSSFEHYENFVKKIYADSPPTDSLKHPFFAFHTINTCTQTSLIFYDQAVIPEDIEVYLREIEKKDFGILLMHHQPEVIKNQDALMEIVNSGKIKLILCGHLHSTDVRCYSINNCQVVNGMAITPHLSWIPSGMQVVCISTRGKVTVKSIKLSVK